MPPIKLVTIGTGDRALKIGNEEVVYRHEKTFVHKPGIALLISDKEPDAKIDEKIKILRCMKRRLTLSLICAFSSFLRNIKKKRILLVSQRFHRIFGGCFPALPAHCQQRNYHGHSTCNCKYPPTHLSFISKIFEPFIHYKKDNRTGNYKCYQNPFCQDYK